MLSEKLTVQHLYQPQDPRCSIKIEQGQRGGLGCEVKAEGKTPEEAFNKAMELFGMFESFKQTKEVEKDG